MRGALAKADEIGAQTHSFVPLQFSNPANPLIHETTTGYMSLHAETVVVVL